jgi:hypothetical protein
MFFLLLPQINNWTGRKTVPALTGQSATPEPPTLLSLFMSQVQPNSMLFKWEGYDDIPIAGTRSRIYFIVYHDMTTNSKFLSFYVPRSVHAFDIIGFLATTYHSFFAELDAKHFAVAKGQGETSSVNSKELRFTGRVFVYHENDLTPKQVGFLWELFKKHGAEAQFRGSDHIMAVYSSIKAGSVSPPPVYEIRDGIPKPVATMAAGKSSGTVQPGDSFMVPIPSPVPTQQKSAIEVLVRGHYFRLPPGQPRPRPWLTLIAVLRVVNHDRTKPNRTTNWRMFLGDRDNEGIEGVRSTAPPSEVRTSGSVPNATYIGDRMIPPADHIDGILWAQFLSPPDEIEGLVVRIKYQDIDGVERTEATHMPYVE